MSKTITIKIPTSEGIKEAQGKVCFLKLGEKRHKFFLQKTECSEIFLTDFYSGMKLGSLTPIKISAMRSYQRITDRAAAQEYIDRLLRSHGYARVVETINAAVRIN